ncbi:hypothetical protein V3C99_002899, partial [Haemonchus contortus]
EDIKLDVVLTYCTSVRKKGLLPMDTATRIDPFKASGIWKRECASWTAGGRRSRQRIIFEIFRCDCLVWALGIV